MKRKIKPRERDAIIQSLGAGVVPRIGLQYIQVNRLDEINAIIKDLDRVGAKGTAIRFIIGRYGSGKSFFLNLSRILAMEKKFVVAHSDITQNVRLTGSGGQAQALYSELIHNFSIKSKPDGGALSSIVERWIADLDFKLKEEGKTPEQVILSIRNELRPLQDYVSGYDFAHVISKYYEGFISGNDILTASAIRWLSGEYTTKTEARQDLGVRSIISDENIYEYLKLWAHFVTMAGYSGLVVFLDEMGILSHGLNSAKSRNSNYDMILRIVNDCFQGNVQSLGFFFAGTDDFVYDTRRGLSSHEALARRLARPTFAIEGIKDYSSPVIHLDNLSLEDTVVLLYNIRSVFAYGDESKHLIPNEGIEEFIKYSARTLGSEFFQTPGKIVKNYVSLLSILEQNPGKSWEEILSLNKSVTDKKKVQIEKTSKDRPDDIKDEDLTTLKL